jgi:hypothetical protein
MPAVLHVEEILCRVEKGKVPYQGRSGRMQSGPRTISVSPRTLTSERKKISLGSKALCPSS